MATSLNDSRILAAIDVVMAWERSQVGKANAHSIWSLAYPAWADTGYAWCGGFQVAAYKQAGIDLLKCAWWMYTPYILNFARQIGAWKTSGQNYGDQPLFDWQLDGTIDHVGAAWPDPNAAAFRSVEGNTSPGDAGSQSNGGGCWVRHRTKPTLRGWVDMRRVLAWMIDTGRWDGKVKTITTAPATATGKAKTSTDGQDALDVDGVRGSATNARWQQVMGTPIDGRIDSPSPCVKAFQRFLNKASGPHILNLTGKALLDVDGILGPKTWRVFQFWSGNYSPGHMRNIAGFTLTSATFSRWVDGIEGDWTVRMLQALLNDSYANSGRLGR